MNAQPSTDATDRILDDSDFAALLEFRDGLRQFLRWSEGQAKAAGLTTAQHQLLLAVRGHTGTASISDIAGHLLLRHHSVVELVDRAAKAGFVRRFDDDLDQRVVRVQLTEEGEQRLLSLAATHMEELSRVGPQLNGLWQRLPDSADD